MPAPTLLREGSSTPGSKLAAPVPQGTPQPPGCCTDIATGLPAHLLPRQTRQVPGSKSLQDAGDRLGTLIADTRQGPWCQPSHSERHPTTTQPRQSIAAPCRLEGLAGRSRSAWCLLQGSAPWPGVPPPTSWQGEALALTQATLGACPHKRGTALLASCYLEAALK